MDLTPDVRNRTYDRSRFSLARTQFDSFLSPDVTQSTIQGSQFHFLEENDVLINVSRAIFDEFKTWSAEKEDYRDAIENFHQTSENSVRIIRHLLQGQRKVDNRLKSVLQQLTREKNAFNLILKLLDSERLIEVQKENEPSSYLQKLFIDNREFRRIITLLHWSEEIAYENPIGFSQLSGEYNSFDNCANVYAQTTLHGDFIHFDSRFGDQKLAEEDEKSIKRLNSVVFSLLRCGRLKEAKSLIERVGLSSIGSFLILREFLTNTELTPIDPLDDEYGLAESRMFFKRAARELVQTPSDKILPADQCLWSALSGFLEPLISFSVNTDDRLWSYLTCAVDSLLDETLIKSHEIKNSELVDFVNEDEIPKDLETIFTEIKNSDSCPYFTIYRYLATDHLADATTIADEIILLYVDVLIDLKLYTLVPFYLSLIPDEIGSQKMVDFFYEIRLFEDQRQEIVQQASEVGFDSRDLCVRLFEKAKIVNKLSQNQNESRQSFHNLLSCFAWLTFDPENLFRALIEANVLLRKLMFHDHISEAVEFLGTLPEDLIAQVEAIFEREFGDNERPVMIADALKEHTSYMMYFEAIENYNAWLRHSRSPAPEFPMKIPEETWSRMDIRRRAEYDLSLQQARDTLSKYLFLKDTLKNAAVESFENILANAKDWLLSRLHEDQDPDRESELSEIHERYLFVLVKTLVSLHEENDNHDKILEIAQRLTDPQHELYNHFSMPNLKRLLEMISKSGAALI